MASLPSNISRGATDGIRLSLRAWPQRRSLVRGRKDFQSWMTKARLDNDSDVRRDTDVKLSADQDLQNTRWEAESVASSYGWIGGLVVIGGAVALSILYKENIQELLREFTAEVEGMGTLGYISYAGLYVILETVAVPATPLTLAAGYLFGIVPGVCVVSLSSTLAAVLAFLISRYLLRERATEFFSGNKQFAAIDRATAKDGFKFVLLLRLSPLLPFAASNYLYGLTSVRLRDYAIGSWLGMLPGTWAYISAGDVGRQVVDGEGPGLPPWEIAVGLIVTVVVLLIVGNLAKNALKEIEEEG